MTESVFDLVDEMISTSISRQHLKLSCRSISTYPNRSLHPNTTALHSPNFTPKYTGGFTSGISLKPPNRNTKKSSTRVVCRASLTNILIGVGLFFTPAAVFCLYALVIGKGDFKHGVSAALSQISRGYLQPELGGPKVPVCDAEFSDLMSDRPLFCFLYDWYTSSNRPFC